MTNAYGKYTHLGSILFVIQQRDSIMYLTIVEMMAFLAGVF